MDINYKSQWGYMVQAGPRWPTRASRCTSSIGPGNRPSHEQAAATFDGRRPLPPSGLQECPPAGRHRLLPDRHLDRWHDRRREVRVRHPGRRRASTSHAENLPRNAWKELVRPAKYGSRPSPGSDRRMSSSRSSRSGSSRTSACSRGTRGRVPLSTLKCDRDYRDRRGLEGSRGPRRASGSCSMIAAASSTSPTTSASRRRRSSTRPTTAAIRRTCSHSSRATCTPSRLPSTRS